MSAKSHSFLKITSLLLALCSVPLIANRLGAPALAHGSHSAHMTFSAGVPGDRKKPSRTIKVLMRENGKKMLFVPNRIEVRKGEQIKFVLENEGTEDHEFMLAT